jgi:hypothetical protein
MLFAMRLEVESGQLHSAASIEKAAPHVQPKMGPRAVLEGHDVDTLRTKGCVWLARDVATATQPTRPMQIRPSRSSQGKFSFQLKQARSGVRSARAVPSRTAPHEARRKRRLRQCWQGAAPRLNQPALPDKPQPPAPVRRPRRNWPWAHRRSVLPRSRAEDR